MIKLKKIIEYTLKGFFVFTILLIAAYVAAVVYISYHKAELLVKVRQQVAENLNGNFSIGNIELSFMDHFPSVAVLVENIAVQDSQFTVHKHPFFSAKRIYATISILSILKKENPISSLEIDSCRLYIFTDTTGFTNSYLFKPKKSKTSDSSTTKSNIEKFVLKNVRLTIDNQQKQKVFDFDIQKMKCHVENEEPIISIQSENKILIHQMAFNLQVGGYLQEKLLTGAIDITFNKKNEQLNFIAKKIEIQHQPFSIVGGFSFGKDPSYSLQIQTSKIAYNFAQNLLTTKLNKTLSIVKMTKPLSSVSANISGSLQGGEPSININWVSSSKNNLVTPFADFTNCSFSGSFVNQLKKDTARCDENSRISIKGFSGYYKDLKVSSNLALIDNLTFPTLQTDIQSNFLLSDLNSLLASNVVELTEGTGSFNIKYVGSITNLIDNTTRINGIVSLSRGILKYKPTNTEITNANCSIAFRNKDIFIDNLNGSVNGNKLIINGVGKDFLSIFNANTDKANIDWSIYSPYINLTKLNSLFQKNETTAKYLSPASSIHNTSFKMDKIIREANFRVNVKADEIVFNKFNATKLVGNFSIKDESWNFHQLSLNHSGGNLFISGALTPKNNSVYTSNVDVKMNNVDINKVMYAFEDFGQTGISYNNLKGKLNVQANLKMDIDRNMQKRPETMIGQIDFSLKNGMLLNYEPLKKIQSIIFKKRNFDEIKFAQLTDRLTINNGEITINKMEIQSTAITMYVEGTYSSSGKTDISIQVPLKNLQKRNDDYIPLNKGSNAKAGASIFLRGQTGSDGLVQFKLDLFKKLRGKKT